MPQFSDSFISLIFWLLIVKASAIQQNLSREPRGTRSSLNIIIDNHTAHDSRNNNDDSLSFGNPDEQSAKERIDSNNGDTNHRLRRLSIRNNIQGIVMQTVQDVKVYTRENPPPEDIIIDMIS